MGDLFGDRPRWQPMARPSRLGTALVYITIGFAALTLTGLVLLWPRDPLPKLDVIQGARDGYGATVESVSNVECAGAQNPEVRCIRVVFLLHEGPDAGDRQTIEFPIANDPQVDPGDTVLLGYQPQAPEGFEYSYLDFERRPSMLWLALLFAASVVALGRLRGLAALAGLAGSFLILFFFVIPAIMVGTSPLLVAIVGAAAIAFVALYLAHGFNLQTTTAVLGTIGSLLLTALLAVIWVGLGHFTGRGSEEAFVVQLGATEVDLSGLLLAGVVIGALGAIDDMAATQASAVWELRAANPGTPRRSLLRSALKIGRDHVASTVNTLVLAYAGASLPLLIVFLLAKQQTGLVVNSEQISEEIVRTLVGSIGLVACVPITTWLAVLTASEPEQRGGKSAVPARRGRGGRHRASGLGRSRPADSQDHAPNQPNHGAEGS